MELPLFSLLTPNGELIAPGELVWSEPHDKADGAESFCYAIPAGQVILSVWRESLHEVIYQTPATNEQGAAARNKFLFQHYGDGIAFNEILDNGFGKTYRRADMQRFALWSYAMDFTTVGTMDFHAVRWG
jgi:hypothetical protein